MPPPDPDLRLPILGTTAGNIAQHVLVVGDPARAEDTARRLDESREVGRNREYVSFTGVYDGVPVTVCSHGVGASGAATCFEELGRAGVRRIVRAGTCGGLQEEVGDGDLIVGTAAVRDDGLTERLIGLAYPAVADPRLTLQLEDQARRTGQQTHVGVVHTAANFHPPSIGEPSWKVWRQAGAVAIEMEYAALLVIASLHGIEAGGIFTSDGNLLTAEADMSDYAPHREVVEDGKRAMITAALQALVADA